MKALKPAIATTASAGIRRMEAVQPSALGMRTCGGKVVLANGCVKSEHPNRKAPYALRGADGRWAKASRWPEMLVAGK